MPNHCRNVLSIIGSKEEVDRFVKQANGPKPNYPPQGSWDENKSEEERTQILSFHQLIPIPDEVIARPYGDMKVYGGYQAERDLWGVKWGAYDDEIVFHHEGIVKYSFTTAWSPPYTFLETVSKQFPNLTFLLSYSEEYPTRGRFAVRNGESLESIDEEPSKFDEYPEYSEDLADSVDMYENKYHELCKSITDHYVNIHDDWVAGYE